MTNHIRWGSTTRFANVVSSMKHSAIPDMIFRSKVKLHGTNTAFGFQNGVLHIQGRNEIFTSPETDTFGFREFILSTQPKFPGFDKWNVPVTFYGEWCGPGCAKNSDVVSRIGERTFFIFAVLVGETFESGTLVAEPVVIQMFLDQVYAAIPDRIKVLEWFSETKLSALDKEANRQSFEEIMADVDAIGNEDPYISKVFGISGPGEGLVFFQYPNDAPSAAQTFRFKAKSDRHDVIKRSHSKSPEIVISETVKDFLSAFVTENRVIQMAAENNVEITAQNLRVLVPAVIRDVLKEGADEIAASGLEVKQIGKVAPDYIRAIVFRQMKENAFA